MVSVTEVRQRLVHALLTDPGASAGRTPYQNGRIRFNFQTRSPVDVNRPFARETYDYEGSIISFMLGSPDADAHQPNAGRVMIIRGATGAGKTTTIEYCAARAVERSKKTGQDAELSIVQLQFNDVEGLLLENRGTIELGYIWRYIASKVGDVFEVDMDPGVEAGAFLQWCSHQSELKAHIAPLFRLLETVLPKVDAFVERRGLGTLTVDQLLDQLVREREILLANLTEKEVALYRIAKFRFSLENEFATKRRAVLIVDNVDHLPPSFQIELVRFSMWVAQFLGFKLVIAVRPLTWENLHGHHVLHVEDHLSPSLSDAIAGRLGYFAQGRNVNEDTKLAVGALVSELRNSHSHLRTLVYGTSGISVRAAVRNFSNFLLSPLLDRHTLQDIATRNIRVSDLVRAYFFSTDNSIDHNMFDNLYSVGQRRVSHLALLKGRIIDFVLRARVGRSTIWEIIEFLTAFGYSEDNILVAINELMYRGRSLLWSDEAFRFDQLDAASRRATISIAPLGCSYYANLFGEYFYTEVCLANSRIETVPTQTIIAYSRDLIDQDEREIACFLSNRSALEYQAVYPYELPSLSFLYWTRFERGAQQREREDRGVIFDSGWRNRIQKFVEDRTSLPYLTAR